MIFLFFFSHFRWVSSCIAGRHCQLMSGERKKTTFVDRKIHKNVETFTKCNDFCADEIRRRTFFLQLEFLHFIWRYISALPTHVHRILFGFFVSDFYFIFYEHFFRSLVFFSLYLNVSFHFTFIFVVVVSLKRWYMFIWRCRFTLCCRIKIKSILSFSFSK